MIDFYMCDMDGRPTGKPLGVSRLLAYRVRRLLGIERRGLVEVKDFSLIYPVTKGEWEIEPHPPVTAPAIKTIYAPIWKASESRMVSHAK